VLHSNLIRLREPDSSDGRRSRIKEAPRGVRREWIHNGNSVFTVTLG